MSARPFAVHSETLRLSLAEPPEEVLVRRLRGGDENAASQLYDRYSRRLMSMIGKKMCSRMRRSTEPEDVVQSVLRSVFMGVRSGHYEAPAGSTLWNLMAIIAMRKLQKRYREMNQPSKGGDRRLDETIDWDEVIDGQSLEVLEEGIREFLEPLRPAEKEIVTLRLHQYSVEEISQRIGRSRRSIERILQRCRSQLSAQLRDSSSN